MSVLRIVIDRKNKKPWHLWLPLAPAYVLLALVTLLLIPFLFLAALIYIGIKTLSFFIHTFFLFLAMVRAMAGTSIEIEGQKQKIIIRIED